MHINTHTYMHSLKHMHMLYIRLGKYKIMQFLEVLSNIIDVICASPHPLPIGRKSCLVLDLANYPGLALSRILEDNLLWSLLLDRLCGDLNENDLIGSQGVTLL